MNATTNHSIIAADEALDALNDLQQLVLRALQLQAAPTTDLSAGLRHLLSTIVDKLEVMIDTQDKLFLGRVADVDGAHDAQLEGLNAVQSLLVLARHSHGADDDLGALLAEAELFAEDLADEFDV
ncbi:MAG: hypothetical protein KGN16_15020 [Burkholderiales bacterium]|nr:hypothetical protein [Burkholderiales bacterium]